jgi:hypothetical protein
VLGWPPGGGAGPEVLHRLWLGHGCPALGRAWPGNDPSEDRLPSQERELRRERLIEEGII